jgi:hypothetical protein
VLDISSSTITQRRLCAQFAMFWLTEAATLPHLCADEKASASRQKSRQPSRAAACGHLDRECLFFDLVHAVASFGLCGLDLEAVLLGGGREEAPNAVRLPIRGLLDLG